MRPSRYPRIPIPKFSTQEIKTADLCARALWYGINFQTGKSQHSDAFLLETFAHHFSYFHKTKTQYRPDVMEADIKRLIKTCKVTNLYRSLAKIDLKKGRNTIYTSVYKAYHKHLKNPNLNSAIEDSLDCLWAQSKGFIANPNHNCLNLASRILFFMAPSLQIFNMNRKVAVLLGLKVEPISHYRELYQVLYKGLKTNQTQLSKYKLPKRRDTLDLIIWNETIRTNWWERRILDIAILIKFNLASVHPQLDSLIKAQHKQDGVDLIIT